MASSILQFLLTGLTVGAVYALIALGIQIAYSATGIVNFAQGHLVMIGTFLAFTMLESWGLPIAVTGIVCVGIMAVAGILLDVAGFRLIRSREKQLPAVMLTLGVAIAAEGTAIALWGHDARFVVPFSGTYDAIQIGPAAISPQAPFVWVGTTILLAAMYVAYQRTLWGKAQRAAAVDQVGAQSVGIDLKRTRTTALAVGAGLAGAAGFLIAPLTAAKAELGIPFVLAGFAGAMVGGLSTPVGAILGGLAIGVAQSVGGGLLGSAFRDPIVYVSIILILFLRPQGLFGTPLELAASES